MFKRLVIGIVVLIGVFFVSVLVYVYLNQDVILNRFKEQVNQLAGVKVAVESLEVEYWSSFPKLSILANQVMLSSPSGEIVSAKSVYFKFNVFGALTGRFTIDEIRLIDGNINLIRQGEQWNIEQFSSQNGTNPKNKPFFWLKNIRLEDCNLNIKDVDRGISANVRAGIINFKIEAEILKSVSGQLSVADIASIGRSYFSNSIQLELDLDNREGALLVRKATIKQGNSEVLMTGEINNGNVDLIFDFIDPNLDLSKQLGISRLNEWVDQNQIQGNFKGAGNLTGNFNDLSQLALKLNFQSSEFSAHFDDHLQVSQTRLSGIFESVELKTLGKAHIGISKFEGKLNGEKVHAEIRNYDINSNIMELSLKGRQEVNSLVNFFNYTELNKIDGFIDLDIRYSGPVGKEDFVADMGTLEGEIQIDSIRFRYKNYPLAVNITSGSALIDNNSLALNELAFTLGPSEFKVTGVQHNFLDYLLGSEDNLKLDADVAANLIDYSGLIPPKEDKPNDWKLELPDNWIVKINLLADEFRYNNFKGTALTGSFFLAEKNLRFINAGLETCGGTILANGYLKQQGDSLEIYALNTGQELEITKVFTSFNNFSQSFITVENLSGKVDFDAGVNLTTTQHLTPDWSTLNAIITYEIREGSLLNFEPVYALESYFKKEDLSRLNFETLNGEVVVRNSLIAFPSTQIPTNIRTIEIEGTHSFDKTIEYHVKIPLKKDERSENSISPNIFLLIEGTTDNFSVTLDKTAIIDKMKDDLRKEMNDLKKSFDKKKKRKQELELSQDDYFDF